MVPQQFYVVIPEYRIILMKNTMAFMLGSILEVLCLISKNGTI
jgi:hypothetical protein